MLSRGFVVLWIAMLVAMAGIGMVSPLLPVYVREDLGGPELAVALSFSGLALSQILVSPFVGRFGDRFGPKRFIVGGFFIYCIGAIGYVFASEWELVVAFRILSGLGAAGIFPMSLAYIGRLAPRGREGTYMGIFSVSQIAGFGLGPLMGGAIRDAVDSQTAFATMALLLGGTGLLTLLLLPGRPRPRGAGEEYRPPEEPSLPWRDLIRRPFVQAALSVQTVVSLGWGAGAAYVAIFVISEDGLGTDSALFVGILLATRSLISAALQPWTGRIADRVDRTSLVMVGLGISAAGQFLFPSVPRTLVETTVLGNALVIAPWLLVVTAVVGIAEAFAWPAEQAIFVTVGRAVGMGSIMGLNQMGSSLGFLAGSLVGAVVVASFGLDNVFRYAGIATLVGALVFFVLMRRAAEELRELERAAAASEPPTGAAAGG